MSEFFKFEKNGRDFPYYKHNPKLSKTAWIILLLSIPTAFLMYSIFGIASEFIGSLLFLSTMLIPLLYFSNWDYSLMFHKPTKNEIILAVGLFIGYLIYAVAIDTILGSFSTSSQVTPETMDVTVEMTVCLIYSMMAEELVKFIPLMFLLRLFYKFSNNRKLSVIISTIIVLICFGMLHYDPYLTPLVSVIFIQGFGSIFEVYGYLKTKNLFVPYISHILTDGVIFILVLLGL